MNGKMLWPDKVIWQNTLKSNIVISGEKLQPDKRILFGLAQITRSFSKEILY